MRLIIGLGNPEEKYKMTRHNLGQTIVDALVDKKQLSWQAHKNLKSFTTDFRHGQEKIILAKATIYMNESGQAVKALKSYYKLPTNKIIVIHDELDLPLGKIRLSKGRGAGGHNGVQSVIDILGSADFKRIRLGIGPKKGEADQFVLERFAKEEKDKLNEIIDTCHLIIEYIIENRFDPAANKYNEKSPS